MSRTNTNEGTHLPRGRWAGIAAAAAMAVLISSHASPASAARFNKRVKQTLVSAVGAVAVAATMAHAPPAEAWSHSKSGVGSVQLVGEDHQPLPIFEGPKGKTWALGHKGDAYTIRIRNSGGDRVEAVTAVDGKDVVSGKPATKHESGYLIRPYDRVDIKGFRESMGSVGRFRFSDVASSYAALTGDDRRTGIIGAAIFPEKQREPVYTTRGSATRGGATRGGATRGGGGATRGLGTEYGESVRSDVTMVEFTRANPDRPAGVLQVNYTDVKGLRLLGIPEREIQAALGAGDELGPFTDGTGDNGFAPRPGRR